MASEHALFVLQNTVFGVGDDLCVFCGQSTRRCNQGLFLILILKWLQFLIDFFHNYSVFYQEVEPR